MKKNIKKAYKSPSINSSEVVKISLYGSNTKRSVADAEILLAVNVS